MNAARAFTQEVYVWQRQFTPAVYQAVNAIRSKVDGIAVLAAEISWSGSMPTLSKSSMSHAQLASTGKNVSLVLRIGPYAGTFSQHDRAANYLVETAAAILKEAKAGGLTPAELQVDFDCASSKLAGYREWITALRAAVAPTRLIFTALPDWLGRKDFANLARSACGYVLQVHSLEKPSGPDENFQLCDPDRSWAWIEKAALVGVPFRVALPTYGYRLAFDPTGKFIALTAEGVSPSWPEGTQVRVVRADAHALAIFAARIAREKPAACGGIIWFRLPVPDDELNWNMTTLEALLGGRIPVSRLGVEARWKSPTLAEIYLVNAGEQDEVLPDKIRTRWSGRESPQMMDGLGGYLAAFNSPSREAIVLIPRAATAGKVIAPGHTRKIGWLHFNHESDLFTEISTSP